MAISGIKGQQYNLANSPFSSGGEGAIYDIVNGSNLVAKIYRTEMRSAELEAKLRFMVRRHPGSRIASMVAWPQDVIFDNGKFTGFIMSKLNVGAELSVLYKYSPGKQSFTTKQKIVVAQNICVVISEVHKAGFVFGDFNPANIGVNLSTCYVSFLDTDTYHIFDDGNGKTYRCNVCLDGYVAPEVLRACGSGKNYSTAPLPTFTKESDNFALAIHIFRLLMNGVNPYTGIAENQRVSQAAPSTGSDAVRRDEYCFKPGKKPTISFLPSPNAVPSQIMGFFSRAFIEGRTNPHRRPNATEWCEALENYKNALRVCSHNTAHQYWSALNICPWCEADKRYNNSISPSSNMASVSAATAISNITHQPVVQIKKTTTIRYGNGVYSGETVNNTKHGYGKYVWDTGDWYQGDWVNGAQTGKGVYTVMNSQGSGYTYNGDFINGIWHGQGKIVWTNGDWYQGTWVNGAQTGKGQLFGVNFQGLVYAYIGDFVDGIKHGYGAIVWSNGATYEGPWINGVPVG